MAMIITCIQHIRKGAIILAIIIAFASLVLFTDYTTEAATLPSTGTVEIVRP
jgi:hypothetical protein